MISPQQNATVPYSCAHCYSRPDRYRPPHSHRYATSPPAYYHSLA